MSSDLGEEEVRKKAIFFKNTLMFLCKRKEIFHFLGSFIIEYIVSLIVVEAFSFTSRKKARKTLNRKASCVSFFWLEEAFCVPCVSFVMFGAVFMHYSLHSLLLGSSDSLHKLIICVASNIKGEK